MKRFKTIFTSAVMFMTVVVMSGLTAPIATKAAAQAGDLIKKDGLSAVYYLGEDGKRYVFPNESTYKSWYSDFSGVVTVSSDELASYPLGANVVVRPGTKLVKITTDPKVYAVEEDGTLRWVQTEEDAIALYGENWASRVIDVADSFFTNYTIGTPLDSNEIPQGSLVQKAGENEIYYFDGTDYRMIEDEVAFLANRFQFENVLTVNDFTPSGETITGSEASISKTSQTGAATGPVVTGSGITVALNSTTPASMNVPQGSSVEFLKVNLTAANDGPVNVNSLTLTAFGLSDSDNIDDVTIYDNGVKVGSSKNINSDREATFNFSDPIHVSAGLTKTLSVKATVAEDYGSYGLGIASASDIISTGANVSGSFPVQGNLMSPVQSTVGTINVTNQNTADGYTATFGEDDVLLADFKLEANEEDALFQSIRLYNEGTRSDDIISNPVLYIDGEKVAEGTYADRYVSFNFDYEVEKSDFIIAEVRADINIADKSDTIELDFDDNNDVVAVGMTHGFTLTTDAENKLDGVTVTLTTGDFSIDMDKSATPAKEVKPGSTNVILATTLFESQGENSTILSIDGQYFTIEGEEELENIKMVDTSNGATYDFEVEYNATTTSYELSLDEEISLVKGVTKRFEVRADIIDGATEGSEFTVMLEGDALDIEGDVSGAEITDITPNEVTSAVVTVKKASLALNDVTLTDLSVVSGSQNQLVYQANVKAGSADDVRIQSITVTATSGVQFTNDNITALTIYLDGNKMKTESNRINTDSVTFSSLTNNVVDAGETSVITVEADFSSNLDAGSFELTVDDMIARSVDGNEALTGTALTMSKAGSRAITIAERGTLTVAIATDDSSANNDLLVLAGSESDSDYYLGEIKFTTANEEILVEDLSLEVRGASTTADSSDIESVKLYNKEGSLIAEQIVESDGAAIFEDVDIRFESDKTTSLFIAVKTRGINDGGAMATAEAGTTIAYDLGDVKARGVSSAETLTPTTTASYTNVATIVGSKLNSISNSLADGKLTNGNNRTIAEYTLVFNNGENQDGDSEEVKAYLDIFALDISSSSVTVDNLNLYIEGESEIKATSADGGATWTGLDNLDMDGEVTLVVTADIDGATENSWLQTQLDVEGGAVQYYDSAETTPVVYNVAGLISVTTVDGAYLEN